MTASGSAWLAVTSAPTVKSERPIRPLIGAGTLVKRRLIRAVSQRRIVLRDRGARLTGLRGRVGIILLGDRLHLGQRAVAVGPGLRGFGAGAGACEVGLRPG